MAEETSIMRSIRDPQTGEERLTIFATDGKPKTKSEFTKAFSQYADTLKAPEGYTVLEPGVVSTLRKGFETVNQPLQSTLKGIGSTVGTELAPTGFAALLERLEALKQGTSERISQTGSRIGESVGEAIGSTVNTPEKALGTGAGLAASALTSGAVPAFGTMSRPLQALGAGVATSLGHMLGSAATGTQVKPGTAAVEGLIAAVSQGATGLIRTLGNGALKAKSQEAMAGKLADLIKNDYRQLINDPNALEAIAGTKEGLAKLTSIAMDTFKNEYDDVATSIISHIENRAPHSLSRTAAHTLRKQTTELFDAVRGRLNVLDDAEALKVANSKVNEVYNNMRKTLGSEYVKQPKEEILKLANEIEVAAKPTLDKLNEYSELLGMLKRTGADRGFNVRAFQQEIQNKFKMDPEALTNQAREIAFRGRSATGSGYDTNRFFKGMDYHPFGSKFPVALKVPGTGSHYIGSADSVSSGLIGQMSGKAALQSFIGESD